MDLDEILVLVGDWDKYQYLLLLFVCLPMCMPCGITAMMQIFTTFVPDHWCLVPDLLETNLTTEQRKRISIPFHDMKYSKCVYYDLNYSDLLQRGNLPLDLNDVPVKSCDYGWEYDMSEITSSVVADFNLVCDREILPTVALALLNIGGLIGVFVFGYITDRLGRKISYFSCLTVAVTSGMASALAPEYISWSLSRLVSGLTIPAILHIPFVICLEVVAPAKRTLVSFWSNMYYVLGLCLVPAVAYLVPEWKSLFYVTHVPFAAFYIYLFFLPESLRWLLAAGKIDDAKKTLQKIAEVNKQTPPDSAWKQFTDKAEQDLKTTKETRKRSRVGFRDLFRTPNMRIKTAIISFSWIVNESVYVGLTYYGPAMATDPYLGFFLSCIVEVPGYFLAYVLMDRWGRRILLFVCMILSGVSAVATALIPHDAVITTLILYLIAKMSISAGTMIIFQFGGELYPTEVRGVGIAFSAYLGGMSLVFIPFLNYLGTNWLILPIVTMGVLCLLGGVATLRLPETLNEKLPQTLEEGENFGKNISWHSSLVSDLRTCWCRRIGNDNDTNPAERKTRAVDGGKDSPPEVFQMD